MIHFGTASCAEGPCCARINIESNYPNIPDILFTIGHLEECLISAMVD